MSRARLALVVVGAAVLGSQAGHLLAYQLRFGELAGRMQSTGVHSYFPAVAKTGLGLASFALLAGLLLTGMARAIARKPVPGAPAPSFLSLLAGIFTLQLGLFFAQETAEALLGGTPAGSGPLLLMWGAVGQLPVAIVAAIAVRWILVRVRPALAALRLDRPAVQLILPVAIQRLPDRVAPVAVEVVDRAFVRGPPHF